MATVRTKLMTAEEFYEWASRPENEDRNCDLVRGEVEEMPRPGKLHGFVCARITSILMEFAHRRRKGYVCCNDTGVIVERNPDTVRGPDVMFFEDGETLDDIEDYFGETPPLLAVEVLPPNDTAGKLMERVMDQIRFGTRLVWVFDPDARNVTVYRPGKEPYLVRLADELTGEDALADFRHPVADFFAMPWQASRPPSKKPSKPPRRKKKGDA